MHVVQLISHYLPAVRYGGPQQVAHGLGRALVAKGHRVSVITTNLKNETEDLDVPTNQPVNRDGVMVRYLPTRWSRYWGYAPQMYQAAKRAIAGADAVIVHFHYQYANHVGARLARAHRLPYLLFAHGSFKRDAMRRRSRILKALYLDLLERSNLRRATNIVFNAEEEQRLSRFHDTGVVIPNAIDPGDLTLPKSRGWLREKLKLQADRRVFVFMGRIDFHGKGLDLLLPAIARIEKTQRPHFVFAGPSERQGVQALHGLAEQLEIANDISTIGMVVGQEKLQTYADADAFLLPSRSEGSSIALLEAMYLGLPILTTDQVGLHEQVDQLGAGKVVRPTLEGIDHGLRWLLDDERRERMRGQASTFVSKHHTWSVVADQVLPLLGASQGSPPQGLHREPHA